MGCARLLVRRHRFDLIYNVCEIFDIFVCALAVYRAKSLFARVSLTGSPDMTLAIGRGRKVRKQTHERMKTRTNILFTM